MSASLIASPRSVRRPRVDVHPPITHSYAPVAIELAAAAGLVLDDWQQDALTTMLAVRPGGKWLCFEYGEIVGRQNGKGSILEARALAGLLLFGEQLVMWSAHEYKTAMEGFRRVLVLLKRLGHQVNPNNDNLWSVDGILVKIVNTNGEESLERLDTGARLKFIARSKGSGRGFSGDCIIIDEAFAYTLEQQEALMFTLSARPNPQIIYTSSPPLDGVSGDVMYHLRERALSGGDDSLGWRDWGLDGDLENLDDIELDDRELWAATNPAYPHRLSETAVLRERRANSPAGFARERLGIWPRRIRGGGGVIPVELWRSLVLEDPERPADVALSVVINHTRSHSAIVAVGPIADGRLVISVMDNWPGTAWVVGRLVELRERWRPVAIAMQDKGPTASLLLDLERAGITPPAEPDRPARGDLAVPWAQEIAAGYGMFVDAVKEQRLAHLDELPLNVAVAEAQTRPLGSGTAWDYRVASSAPLIAATQALWAYLTRRDLVDQGNGEPFNIW